MRISKPVLAIVAACAIPAGAYEVNTHARITERAAGVSVLGERVRDIGLSMGLTSLEAYLGDGGLFVLGPLIYERRLRAIDWVTKGSVDEDSYWGLRFVNHFHNPLAPPGSEGYLGIQTSSQRWGLEPTPDPRQDFSYRDAREYLVQAVIAPSEAERKRNATKLLRTVGHVVHLIQDLGQPQHTRNDSHALGSAYEAYADGRGNSLTFGGYLPVAMPNPESFWVTTRESGLANYSNRGFVTAGTNFRGRRSGNDLVIEPPPDFPRPNGTGSEVIRKQITDPDLLGPVGPGQPLIGEIWFVETPVTDSYTGATAVNPRASTFSIFDEDLAAMGFDWTFTLNNYNYASAQGFLVPRAVGYSAGLIDHLLRPRLQIDPPALGAYAYGDHAANTGFASVTAKITNPAADVALGGGELVLIAKFHVNGCYQPDLSGEFYTDEAGNLLPPPGCDNYRTDEESMLVSAPHAVSLAGGQSVELKFTFPSPIPVNATDLFLQALYRGAVGSDPSGVAVGTKDVAEPTFVAVFNATDAFEIPTASGNRFFYYTDIIANIANAPYSIIDINGDQSFSVPPDVDVRGGNIAYDIFLDGGRIASVPVLPEGRFARLSLLVDPGRFNFRVRAVGNGFNQTSSYSFPARTLQLDHDNRVFVVSPVDKQRDTFQWDRVLYYHYYPSHSADIDLMPASRAAGAGSPVPAEIAAVP